MCGGYFLFCYQAVVVMNNKYYNFTSLCPMTSYCFFGLHNRTITILETQYMIGCSYLTLRQVVKAMLSYIITKSTACLFETA